jgi:hypothetical protein
LFSIDKPDMQLFESFSPKLKEKIESSPEWKAKGSKARTAFDDLEDDANSDVPF